MNNEEMARLKAVAKAATKGPWIHRFDPGNPVGAQHGVKLVGEFGAWVCDCIDNADRLTIGGVAGERNAAHIAAASPDVVLALIERIEALTVDAERYKHLRSTSPKHYVAFYVDDGGMEALEDADLDNAIDAAMALEKK